jgi:hypothetical protein
MLRAHSRLALLSISIFYHFFCSLKRYFGLREPIGYCPDSCVQTRWAKAAVQIVTHGWPPLADSGLSRSRKRMLIGWI